MTHNINLWAPHDLAPIPTLANLRDAVLERSELRMPKWKFRLAPDLILQVQPRAGSRCWFECTAHLAENLTATDFASPLRRLGRDWWHARFHIVVDPQGAWKLVPRSRQWRRGVDRARHFDLRMRVIEAFSGNRFAAITADLMLSPSCLICGKGLTDPASMARFIGPECAGTSSLAVSHVVRLAEAQP
jgi:hypothetical protein